MKRIAVCAGLALLAFFAHAEEAVLLGQAGEYRLTDKPCTLASAVAAVKPEYADKQRAGRLTTKDRIIEFCWLSDGDTVWAMDEDGVLHRGQASDFAPAKSI